MTNPSWWRRNRLRLALLLPLLALAVIASGFRYTNIYRQWGKDHDLDRVATSQPYVFEEEFGTDRKFTFHRTVEVSLVGVRQITMAEDAWPAPGGVLYEARVHLKADPEQVDLASCTIQLVGADGTSYGTIGGKVSREEFPSLDTNPHCTPVDAEGPTVVPFQNKVQQSKNPRPLQWEAWASIAVPATAQIRYVRISWSRPNALLLPVS